ncbi:hypothetical protein BKA70DRAFT_1337480 [Coprinopsis sp. MPI-PUGE-AT-0042]|nr:hypothetical protein BKA70DRAFT_1337480 [Coprinopsis sp. MPI-PUGE-AT-0042]
MYHFPASSSSGLRSSSAARSSSEHVQHGWPSSSTLNATQSKSASNPLFLKIEEELHDARRVREHGQEEDMRLALDMVIGRVTELTSTLSEAYKAQAELEIQLNLARSNLQVIQMNNEMLEDALKKNNAASRDLGWNRRSGAPALPGGGLERSQSVDYPESPASATSSTSENKFFKFRFSTPANQSTQSVPGGQAGSRPGTPVLGNLTSPSMPSLTAARDRERELDELAKELEKERAAKKKALEDKAALEDEIESLSQALFEEANKMVAEERMKLSETIEELNEIKAEKHALQSALRLLDNQTRSSREHGHHQRTSSSEFSFVNASSGSRSPSTSPSGASRRLSTSSSQLGLKSVPTSPLSGLPPLPPSPFPSRPSSTAVNDDWKPPPRKDSLLASVIHREEVSSDGGGNTSLGAISPTSTIKKRLSSTSSIGTYLGSGSGTSINGASEEASGSAAKESSSRADASSTAGIASLAAPSPVTEKGEDDGQPTPRYQPPPLSSSSPPAPAPSSLPSTTSASETSDSQPPSAPPASSGPAMGVELDPWADAPSSSSVGKKGGGGGGPSASPFGGTIAAAYAGMR